MLNLFQSCAKCKSTILILSQIFADQKLKPKFKWEFWMEKTCRSLNHVFVIVVVVVVIIAINVVVAVVVVVIVIVVVVVVVIFIIIVVVIKVVVVVIGPVIITRGFTN